MSALRRAAVRRPLAARFLEEALSESRALLAQVAARRVYRTSSGRGVVIARSILGSIRRSRREARPDDRVPPHHPID